jgi:TPR repeat protein
MEFRKISFKKNSSIEENLLQLKRKALLFKQAFSNLEPDIPDFFYSYRNIEKDLELCSSLFEIASDKGCSEGQWRFSAFLNAAKYFYEDIPEAQAISRRSMIKKSIDGTFWHGRLFTSMIIGFQFFHLAAHQSHSTGRYFKGYCQYFGFGVRQNPIKGNKNFLKAFTSGDAYWTRQHSYFLSTECNYWPVDQVESENKFELSKTESISETSLFFMFPLSPSSYQLCHSERRRH